MKTLITTLFCFLTLTAFAQQRVIVDSITTDSLPKIYYKIEKRQIDTTQQITFTKTDLQAQITISEMALNFLEKSIKLQVPLLDSIKNDRVKQYAIGQIMSQDNQYATIRQDMEILKSVLKELDKVKKK